MMTACQGHLQDAAFAQVEPIRMMKAKTWWRLGGADGGRIVAPRMTGHYAGTRFATLIAC
jgi:hypothetical protein